MTWRNKVAWSEGMFLRPQHFQQQDRYIDALVQARCRPLRGDAWGVATLTIDANALEIGRLAVARATGLLPDGTPFAIPDDDEPPPPMEVPETARDAQVFLALPVAQEGLMDTDRDPSPLAAGRFRAVETEVRDTVANAGGMAAIEVGRRRFRLLLDSANIGQYAATAVAKIRERRASQEVVLDREFIPPCLDCRASAILAGFTVELLGLLRQRGDALAQRAGVQMAQFLRLMVVNRYQPLLAHLTEVDGLHPEVLYQTLLPLAGELATFAPGRRPRGDFGVYRHENLTATFAPLMAELRQLLSLEEQEAAVQLPLEQRRYGIRVAPITDRSLIGNAYFYLAVRADLPADVIRSRFPAQTKLGSVERIAQFVNSHLPGIGLSVLNTPPRELPYYADATYFALDQRGEYWKDLQNSGGLALHVAGDLPGLDLALWAVRRRGAS
ncbi:MAG: type VI secretion system baseplate subunit TssK [Candidatus Competibacterales bacterium]